MPTHCELVLAQIYFVSGPDRGIRPQVIPATLRRFLAHDLVVRRGRCCRRHARVE